MTLVSTLATNDSLPEARLPYQRQRLPLEIEYPINRLSALPLFEAIKNCLLVSDFALFALDITTALIVVNPIVGFLVMGATFLTSLLWIYYDHARQKAKLNSEYRSRVRSLANCPHNQHNFFAGPNNARQLASSFSWELFLSVLLQGALYLTLNFVWMLTDFILVSSLVTNPTILVTFALAMIFVAIGSYYFSLSIEADQKILNTISKHADQCFETCITANSAIIPRK